ncbi:hypothetical protein RN001_009872 [Aquatica leii]|uniref:Peptidase M14 domain-containing protein n=1 Tax=Aquatica leii TaxID=1421715 RepID=A0AAN7S8B6_9COLE|nr:hypothetical protein RN001_009872 [Aquatica leii]
MHSARKCLLYPFGYTKRLPPNIKLLHRLAVDVQNSINIVNGNNYNVGNAPNILKPTSGTSHDWAYAVAGIGLSYALELPGGGTKGFDLPATEILRDRFWRKTRSPGKRFKGVDPNRNFDFKWKKTGASSKEKSGVYCGPRPFSEPETASLSQIIIKHSSHIKLYLTIHSCEKCIIYPYGFTKRLPLNAIQLHNLAIEVQQEIIRVNGNKYLVGNSPTLLKPSSGSSRDWVHGVAGIDLAYTLELPGGGIRGFDLPANDIIRVVTEIFEGIKINDYLDNLALNHRDIVTVKSIGRSYEGRNMKIIQISSNPNANKPVIFIDAGIHAREWIAPAMALYVINQLVENSGNAHLLDLVDWHILPVLNPDGYEYSHTRERFWRKTRSISAGSCVGTDANRNFGFHWGEGGSSSNACSDTYKGPYAFSEVEGRNVKSYIESNKQRIKLYLTFHSYGNYLLYPWGYTSALPENHVELQSIAEDVNAAIVQAGGDEYTIGSSTNVLYIASGGSDDWAKGAAGVQLAYTIELPGGGAQGFDPPPSLITPIVRETFPGIVVYGEYIGQKFGRK